MNGAPSQIGTSWLQAPTTTLLQVSSSMSPYAYLPMLTHLVCHHTLTYQFHHSDYDPAAECEITRMEFGSDEPVVRLSCTSRACLCVARYSFLQPP